MRTQTNEDSTTSEPVGNGLPDAIPPADVPARGPGPVILRSADELRRWRSTPGTVALVPTMGALHAGHLSLVRLAQQNADRVVVSVFVNPTQFGPAEDFDQYPRTLDADVAALAELGVHAVFAPAIATMYPDFPAAAAVTITPGPVATILDGAARPGHFAGVCQVVAKLFNLVRPDVAVFGQKDAQQLAVIEQMVKDLSYPVQIVPAPIVRDADGLALSSRNQYLSPAERQAALALSRAVGGAPAALTTELAGNGATSRTPESLVREAWGTLMAPSAGGESASAAVRPEYAALVDDDFRLLALVEAAPAIRVAAAGQPAPVTQAPQPHTQLAPTAPRIQVFAPDYRGTGRLLVSGRVGSTRLIDNAAVVVG